MIIVVYAFSLFGCCTSATGEPPKSDEYIVWVEALNMRTEPAMGAEIVTVLERGDELKDLGEPPEYVDETWWRHVRVSESDGWIADWYTLPRPYYDAFREADEFGKAGKAEEMVAAAIEAGNAIAQEISDDVFHDVSPDGKNIIIWGAWYYFYWSGNYPDGGRVDSPFPVVLFASDYGLLNYFRSYEDILGEWSPDSRYYAYSSMPVVTHFTTGWLGLIDTNSGTRVKVGRMVQSPRTKGRFGEFEFAEGYLLWIEEESVEGSLSPLLYEDSSTPVLFAYELATGRKLKLLEADLSTIGGEDTRVNWSRSPCYPVKMRAVDPCPKGVERSNLYIKYFEDSGYAINRTHQFD